MCSLRKSSMAPERLRILIREGAAECWNFLKELEFRSSSVIKPAVALFRPVASRPDLTPKTNGKVEIVTKPFHTFALHNKKKNALWVKYMLRDECYAKVYPPFIKWRSLNKKGIDYFSISCKGIYWCKKSPMLFDKVYHIWFCGQVPNLSKLTTLQSHDHATFTQW